ncbi:MAG: YkgJ family cysteine cluster protein [Caldicoprobacterales bacterium]|nr:YkgJ family cysteine cluster protein [Clostridiales bacterium]
MKCRVGCGACCIAPSISSPIPGMPNGKPAGVRCIQLNEDNMCNLYGRKNRPAVCNSFQPSEEMCGQSAQEAYAYLSRLEEQTAI